MKHTPVHICILLLFFGNLQAAAVADTLHPPLNKGRAWLVGGAHVATWGGSFIALNKAWYADYPRAGFHAYNDLKEWQQMDKAGHVWTAYQVSRVSAATWKWAGFTQQKAALLGGISGVAYQSIIEIQDGFSEEWGFSWGDMAANLLGAGSFVAQELTWKKQKISIKLSYNGYNYPNGTKERRDDLFGTSLPERLLKDYNAQTYWVSAPVHLFVPSQKKARWLNVAVGYRANGMLGGYENRWENENGTVVNRTDVPRTREFILAPDIDLTQIPTRKKWVRSLLFVANAVKIPTPGIIWNNKKGWKAGF